MSLYEIYFSPTGGTKKAAVIIAKGIGAPVTRVDMIKQVKALKELAFEKVQRVQAKSGDGKGDENTHIQAAVVKKEIDDLADER